MIIHTLFREKLKDSVMEYAYKLGLFSAFGLLHTFTYTEEGERKHCILIDNLALVSYYTFLTENWTQALMDLISEETLLSIILDEWLPELGKFHQDPRINQWMILDVIDSQLKQLEDKEEIPISIIHQKSFKIGRAHV